MACFNIELPLFPLHLFLLPGGVTRLRLFEPRYLKMIAIAEDGFVILSKAQANDTQQWGSWVEIVNFDQGEDGILEIDVRCKSLVNIISIDTNVNHSIEGLQFIRTHKMSHWSQKKATTDLGKLTDSLVSLVNHHHLLSDLYRDKIPNNPYWVVARWLELLPIPLEVKHLFVSPTSYVEAKRLIHSII